MTPRDLLRASALAASLSACGGAAGEGGGGCAGPGGGLGGGGADEVVVQALELADANNYTFGQEFWTTPIEVEPGADVTVDWSALTTDLRGRPLDPRQIERIALSAVRADADDAYPTLVEGPLDPSVADFVALYDNDTGATSASLSSFTLVGVPFDPATLVAEPDSTWLLSWSNLPEGRTDLLTVAALAPTAGSTNRDAAVTDDLSRIVKVQVDLAGAAPIRADRGGASLDWGDLTVDVFGEPFDPLAADELVVAHFPGDVGSVEAEILRLESAADAWYRLDVFGLTDAVLAEATDAAERPFGGFTAQGTWVVGLVCRSCFSPVPVVLARVDVD